jgi:hypothetical protein
VLRSFVASCELVKVDPFAWFQDVLSRIASHPITRLDELLPDRWSLGGVSVSACQFSTAARRPWKTQERRFPHSHSPGCFPQAQRGHFYRVKEGDILIELAHQSKSPLKRLSVSRYPFSSIGGSCHEKEESLLPSDVVDFSIVARQRVHYRAGPESCSAGSQGDEVV